MLSPLPLTTRVVFFLFPSSSRIVARKDHTSHTSTSDTMPRIIEPIIGKVVGPLRMKVPPLQNNANISTKSHIARDRSETTLNQHDRRGRYSRKQANMKKLRSKSLPQTSNSSLLLGKPPDSDESFCETSSQQVTESKENLNESELKTANSSQMQKSKDSAYTLNGDDSDNYANFTGIFDSKQKSRAPPKRHALAFDTRCLLSKGYEEKKTECRETSLIRHCKHFLRTLDCRDIAPCILAVTTNGNGSITRGSAAVSALGIGIQAYKLVKDSDRTVIDKALDFSDRSIISNVHVLSTEANDGSISIPVALQAKNSWLIFSSLGTLHANHR
jgi:hypothetical protein